MPIDYSKYPPDWKERIRPEILKRAKYKCENCGAPHKSFRVDVSKGCVYYLNSEDAKQENKLGIKTTRIILTISHQDHNIMNNEYNNLKALCQKCHLKYDKELHLMNRKINECERNAPPNSNTKSSEF